MVITDIKTEYFRWPKKTPIRNGKHIFTDNELKLVKIETDEGITGLGTSRSIDYVDYFKPFLIGENPFNTERIWEKLWVPKYIGRRSISTQSISALDIALWDIKSKAANISLYQLLGGHKDRIPCYVAGGYYSEGKGIRELQQEMAEYRSWGVSAVKMKIGGASIREDIARVKAVREVIGEETRLMIDANCAYRFYEAVEFAKRAEEYHPFWFEEPVMPDDYDGFSKLEKHTSIPIAAGENEYTQYGFRDLINTGAIAILNPDAGTMGGITEFMKIAAYAQANHIDISPHGQQQVHTHLACAVPNAILLEFYPLQYDAMTYKIFKNPMVINRDGTVSPNAVPGAGLDPNYDEIERFRIF